MQDLRHALRLFAKSPGFTAIVVITLALGIGANTAVFSIIYGALLRPLPYKDPDRLINILDSSTRESELAKIFASYSDFEEFSRHARTLESIGADTWAGRPGAVLTGRGRTKTYLTIPVTAGFFKVLGVPPQLGRTFTNADLHGACAVVLSNKFWRGPLGSDPHILGQSLSLDDRSCVVRGIMPATFAVYPPETQIWTLILPNDVRLRNDFGVFMIAKLKPGIGIAQVRAELTALHKALHAHDTNGEKDFTPLVSGLQDQFTWLAGRNLRTTLAVVFASVMLVLLIACLNIANLLLGRSFARSREFAIRVALGSGARRLVRQLLVESTVLSLGGAAVGMLFAFAATRYFIHLQPVELPVGSAVSIGLPALVFAAAVSIFTAVIFAITPAWAVLRSDVFSGLRVSGANIAPARQRLARLLIGAEMALSVILLVGAVLLMRSVVSFESAPLGFAHDNIFAANGSLPHGYYDKETRRVAFYESLQQQLSDLPGITNAAIASTLPPYGLGLGTVDIAGKPVSDNAKVHDVGDVAVSPKYFRLFDVPVRLGRVFNEHDRLRSDHVAVINEAFAREYFSNRAPIGQKIRIGAEHEWVTVVGVVGNEKRPTVYEEMKWIVQPAVYRPITQHPPDYFSIAVRSLRAQTAIGRQMEQAIASVDGQAALDDVESMQARLAPYLKYPRFRAIVLGAFSCLAVLLAAVGLYGVLAQFVAQRTAEIGIRMALGAKTSDIGALIARASGSPFLAGLLVGLLASLALTRYLSSLLYGITPTDPFAFAAVILVMLFAAILAMMLPARRALRVDPMTALRSE
ncbi:MAG TPA: ABC transporter permease [Bryobacteraceae bacterium]|nr:ABC transporter permease [Bryobacteraceae bacterium]